MLYPKNFLYFKNFSFDTWKIPSRNTTTVGISERICGIRRGKEYKYDMTRGLREKPSGGGCDYLIECPTRKSAAVVRAYGCVTF